ncbi:hypothetical protein LptCag_0606 [Leptospirillum ferriphilum]|uniref:Uncharacterized protein n=1 Tax=Leptospirillum ferriphilum TaxID=178606 RepID=A0A094WBU8_9BACT|nr:hypothetical protein LptCag_0606 [Leptospirillum ferriphilum]
MHVKFLLNRTRLDKFVNRVFVGPILTPYVKYYFREFFHACFS